jgi:hypothetical protein
MTPMTQDQFCIRCGYNQRGVEAERCPECGVLLADSPASPVRLPWAHRRHIGLLPAYWRTAWQVIFRTKKICAEMEHPVSYADARRFWIMTLAQAWLPFVVGVGLMFFAVHIRDSRWQRDYQDLFISVYVPVPVVWVGLLGLLLFFALATGAPSYFGQNRRLSVREQNRAIALSYYASAPLALMPLLLLLAGVTMVLDHSLRQLAFGIAAVEGLVFLAMVVLWWICSISIPARTARRGWKMTLAMALGLPVMWVLLGFLSMAIAGIAYIGIVSIYSLFQT